MQSLLESIHRSNPALDALVVLDVEGRTLASAGADESHLQVVVGLVSALHSLADRAAAEVGIGGLESLLLHGPEGFFAIAALDGGHYVVGSTGDRTMTGAILADLRRVASGVRAEAA